MLISIWTPLHYLLWLLSSRHYLLSSRADLPVYLVLWLFCGPDLRSLSVSKHEAKAGTVSVTHFWNHLHWARYHSSAQSWAEIFDVLLFWRVPKVLPGLRKSYCNNNVRKSCKSCWARPFPGPEEGTNSSSQNCQWQELMSPLQVIRDSVIFCYGTLLSNCGLWMLILKKTEHGIQLRWRPWD